MNIQGLTSEAGLLLNQKPGLVCGYDKPTGRFIVEVDKNDTGMTSKILLQPCNLQVISFNNDDNQIMLLTMDRCAQWDYIKDRNKKWYCFKAASLQ